MGSSRVSAVIRARSAQLSLRPSGLPSEHGELVTKHQDLDLLAGVGSSAQHQPAQQLGEHQVDQPQRHRRIMPELPLATKQQVRGASRVSGTHRRGRSTHPRSWRASLEHGELVAQDQDLDLLAGVGSGVQHDPAQELGEHLVDQPQRHQRIMPGTCHGRTSRSRVCAQFRAPTGDRHLKFHESWDNLVGSQRLEPRLGIEIRHARRQRLCEPRRWCRGAPRPTRVGAGPGHPRRGRGPAGPRPAHVGPQRASWPT